MNSHTTYSTLEEGKVWVLAKFVFNSQTIALYENDILPWLNAMVKCHYIMPRCTYLYIHNSHNLQHQTHYLAYMVGSRSTVPSNSASKFHPKISFWQKSFLATAGRRRPTRRRTTQQIRKMTCSKNLSDPTWGLTKKYFFTFRWRLNSCQMWTRIFWMFVNTEKSMDLRIGSKQVVTF